MFLNYQENEDMQNDTFKIIGGLIRDAIQMQLAQQPEEYWRRIEALLTISHSRIDKEGAYQEELERIGNDLFNPDKHHTEFEFARLFDDEKKLFREVLKALDDENILFRLVEDLDQLVAKRSA